MKELLRTNDVVLLSFTRDLLTMEGVRHVVFDENMSILEGSIGVLPRRLMVAEDDYEYAAELVAIESQIRDVEYLSKDSFEDRVEKGELTDDQFLGGAIKAFQPKKGFRSGIEAVLLAASVPDLGKMQVLEAGCGVGVVSLAIAARCSDAKIDAVEIEQENALIARANVIRNGFDSRMSIVTGDVCDSLSKLEVLGIRRNTYDFVVANPPFFDKAAAQVSHNRLRASARTGGAELLDEWMRFLTAVSAPNGRFSLIHRADRLAEILAAVDGRFGDICVFPLFPKQGAVANRLIVQGRKGSRAPLRLMEGMVLHDASGAYSEGMNAISRLQLALNIS